MGTYTANYQLYMPTVGEQGWGELMNGNLTTIDTTMKSLSNSIGTLETETDAFDSRIKALEKTIPEEGVIDSEIIKMPTLSYNGYYTISSYQTYYGYGWNATIMMSPLPLNGIVSVKSSDTSKMNSVLNIITKNGLVTHTLTTTQTEYTVEDAYNIFVTMSRISGDINCTLTIGIPTFI